MFELSTGHLIDGAFVDAKEPTRVIESLDPYSGAVLWSTHAADDKLINSAIAAAKTTFPEWASTTVENRKAVIEKFTEQVKAAADDLAQLIAQEGGKPLWEAKTEVNSLVTKFNASVEAFETRAAGFEREVRGRLSRTRFVPHGVMAVLGPFNFPVSMANSHIMPALLAGNTVVFKPSELTPQAGLFMAQLWHEAGLPNGVLNCISGGRDVAQALVRHEDIDGVLFVGSHQAGISILKALTDHPEKIVALEMGGNSPLVIWDYDDIDTVVNIVIQSAFISAGQRCSAARRLLVKHDDDQLLERLSETLKKLRIGHYLESPEPFYGPLIRPDAAEKVISRAKELSNSGATTILEPTISGPGGTLVTPGLYDVTECNTDKDEEIFGPLLKVYRYDSLSTAIEKANDTKFGLAAGIVCRDRRVFEEFFQYAQAGIINWNQQLTGATTFAPFGGIKQSGNFRPAGFLSADYCSYAIASFEVENPTLPENLSPGISFR